MRRRELLFWAGAAMTTARSVGAQQKGIPVIGLLGGASLGPAAGAVAAFRDGLSETGYVEGRNVAIEYRWAEGRFDRLPELAADLVDHKVDVIVTVGDPPTLAAKNATSTIPIVTTFGGDPVTTGLVVSFARPRTNVTGVSMMFAELTSKRLEQLTDLVPQARVIALLVNPNNFATEAIVREAQVAAQTRGVELPILKATSESEIDAAFAALDQLRVGALIVGNDTFFFSRREQLVVLAARRALPASYFLREFSAAGGLISYGPNVMVIYRQVGIYAGKILNGARPADLPVVQPTTFELVVNLKTAKALRLTVPPSILARADEVIE
jgi:putative tryptophan/tyrosine transport system substrate-binding protein